MGDEDENAAETLVVHPESDPPDFLVSLFVARDQLQEAQITGKSRYKAVAITDLEKLIAFIAMYVRNG